MVVPNDWTTERIEILRTMIAAGHSSRQVAEALGLTRNAVIGKARRMNFQLAGSKYGPGHKYVDRPRKQNTGMFKNKTPWPKSTPQPREPMVDRVKPPRPDVLISLMDLTRTTCRWPFGNPDEEGFGYCGQPTNGVRVYCDAHHVWSHEPRKMRSLAGLRMWR